MANQELPDSTTDGASGAVPVSTPPPLTTPIHHPIGFWFFFWGEFAERCSFYGMRTLLPLFLTQELMFDDRQAGAVQSWFKVGAYLLPLAGGYIADRFLGKYWTIVGFSIPYVAGHFVLMIHEEWAVYVALALLAGGSGVIKPNISTLMGLTYDQQRPGQDRLRAAAFMWFYFAINIGSFISTLTLPFVRNNPELGYSVAFLIPAILMVLSLGVFAAGKPFYAVERIEHTPLTSAERAEQWRTLRPLLAIFGLIMFFWIAYEQHDTVWIYFMRDFGEFPAWPWEDKPMKADQLQWINPFLVVTLVPAFNGIFKLLDPNAQYVTRMRKMMAGFILTAISAGLMTAAGYLSGPGEPKVSYLWYVAAFSILTAGEVLLYSTGLEMAYTFAPQRMKGFITALFLLTVMLANLVNVGLIQLYGGDKQDTSSLALSPGNYFAMHTGLIVFATCAFYFVGRRFDRSTQPDQA